MWKRLTALFPRREPRGAITPTPPSVALTDACVATLRSCMAPEIQSGREGIAYLLGLSDGTTTLACSAIRPVARSTPTSFLVDSPAMATVVRAAVRCGLHVVGQVHTHPGRAYHSRGDETGAQIAYTGYISIVLPNYGRHLPGLDASAIYVFHSDGRFDRVNPEQLTIVPGQIT